MSAHVPKPFTKTGRPTKRTREVVARIVQAIEMGATRRLAAAYGGIHVSTLMDWQARFPEFSDQLRAAETRSAVRWLAKIEQAADVSWGAAAWKLERLYPDEYGRRNRTELTGKDDGPVEIEHAGSVNVQLNDVLDKLDAETLGKIIAAIDEAEGEEGA